MRKVFGVKLKIPLSQYSICVKQDCVVAIGNEVNTRINSFWVKTFKIYVTLLRHIKQRLYKVARVAFLC